MMITFQEESKLLEESLKQIFSARINFLWEVIKLKQIFQKINVITGKTPFFVTGQFCTRHCICFNIGF